MKLVIVGGVAGGASAAARSRRLSEDSEIVLFERGPDVSFANCGLPYYVGGEIAQREKLLVTTPEQLRSRFKLDVRTRSSVETIDRSAKKVRVRDLSSGREYEESYDKLILAPGAAPLRPPIPGIDLPGIFTLRNLQDVDLIKKRVDQGVKQAVMVGAGFIGLELVENFVKRGIATTVVELQGQVLPPFDKEMTTPIVETLLANGVTVLLGQSAGAGVDKRIDVLAVAIQAGMTVFDLEEMELAYAPQYGSAKDPINMAGFVAGGLLRGDHPQVDVEAVLAPPPGERSFLLDVRTPQEFASGHIPGAVNIPVDDLRSRQGELPRDRQIAAYCQVGQRGYLATRILFQAGFSAVNVGGGYKTHKLFHPTT